MSSGSLSIRVALTLIPVLGFAGCGKVNPPNVKIHVLVAASFKEATECAVEAYLDRAKQEGKPQIVVVSGASSSLAQQIIAGAPADLFISANSRWSEEVAAQGAAVDPLLTNRLVLAAHKQNAHFTSVDNLSQPEVRSIAIGGDSVPVGEYASQVIEKFSAPLRESVKAKLVFGKDSTAVVAWLENGEADAGFVYASDLGRSSNLIEVQEIESEFHDPIIYSVVILADKDSPNREAADQFLRWLKSKEAAAIYRHAGFMELNNIDESK